MATVYWLDGFELYNDVAELLKVYTMVGTHPTYLGISTSQYRTGAQGLSILGDADGVKWTDVTLTNTTIVFGFAVKISKLTAAVWNNPDIALIDMSGNYILRFIHNTTGHMCVYRGSTLLGTTTNPIWSTTAFNFVEIKVYAHESAGTVEIRLNGNTTPELSLSGIDTIEGSATMIQGFRLTAGFSNGYNYWDDLYLASDFLGDSKIDVIRVTGAGNYSQFAPLSGSNYENVDESRGPDDDTTYNDGDAVNEIDTYQMADLAAGDTIHALKIQGSYKKTDAGTALMKQVLRINSTDYYGDEKTLTTDYTTESDIFNLNPDDSAAFETADINALELGCEVTDLG